MVLRVSPGECAYLSISICNKIACHVGIGSAFFLGLSRLLGTNYRRDSCNFVRRSHGHLCWWRDTRGRKDLELDDTKNFNLNFRRTQKKRKEKKSRCTKNSTQQVAAVYWRRHADFRNKKSNITIKPFSILRFSLSMSVWQRGVVNFTDSSAFVLWRLCDTCWLYRFWFTY